jgi:hypothetical protein
MDSRQSTGRLVACHLVNVLVQGHHATAAGHSGVVLGCI